MQSRKHILGLTYLLFIMKESMSCFSYPGHLILDPRRVFFLPLKQQLVGPILLLQAVYIKPLSHSTNWRSSLQPYNINLTAATKPARRRPFNFSTATNFKVDQLCASFQNFD